MGSVPKLMKQSEIAIVYANQSLNDDGYEPAIMAADAHILSSGSHIDEPAFQSSQRSGTN